MRHPFEAHKRRLITRLLVLLVTLAAAATPESFHFVLLGDRTGSSQPGVYDQVWKETAAADPAFVVTVGDTIEGFDDATAETEWRAFQQLLAPYGRYRVYLAPGNHDIWSEWSERLFRRYAGHAPHYSFDYKQAHFTILDNSRSDSLSAGELAFLEQDLQAHAAQPVKFIVSHRPSWLVEAVVGNPNFALHQLAKKYGVQYVIAGHVHEMLHADLDGVQYVSMVSSGGHLRATKKYEDGWFFAYAVVAVSGNNVTMRIKELDPPHGQGRMTKLQAWGVAGLKGAEAAVAAK